MSKDIFVYVSVVYFKNITTILVFDILMVR